MSDTIVTCACCNTGYTAIWPDSNQAMGCASEIRGDQLSGHYGSTVADMELHVFKGGRPQHIPEGTVCDTCILKFQAEGILEFREDGVW